MLAPIRTSALVEYATIFPLIPEMSPQPSISSFHSGVSSSSCFRRYLIHDFPGGSILRIEPVRKMKEDLNFECVAENGVGDPVSAKAKLEVLQGKLNAKKLGHLKNEKGGGNQCS